MMTVHINPFSFQNGLKTYQFHKQQNNLTQFSSTHKSFLQWAANGRIWNFQFAHKPDPNDEHNLEMKGYFYYSELDPILASYQQFPYPNFFLDCPDHHYKLYTTNRYFPQHSSASLEKCRWYPEKHCCMEHFWWYCYCFPDCKQSLLKTMEPRWVWRSQ